MGRGDTDPAGLGGTLVILAAAWLLSTNHRAINWRTVGVAMSRWSRSPSGSSAGASAGPGWRSSPRASTPSSTSATPGSTSAAANIFVGQTEGFLVIRPYINRMTHSELFSVMTVGMATVAGSVLVGYALLGVPLDYLLAATFRDRGAAQGRSAGPRAAADGR